MAVIPEGLEAIRGLELNGSYYEHAGPVVAIQVARGGYRLAAWLDKIVDVFESESPSPELKIR
jgi:hypothetical protein